MGLPLKKLEMEIYDPNNSASGCVAQRIKSNVSERSLHTHVHNSFIHNSQRMEAA